MKSIKRFDLLPDDKIPSFFAFFATKQQASNNKALKVYLSKELFTLPLFAMPIRIGKEEK